MARVAKRLLTGSAAPLGCALAVLWPAPAAASDLKLFTADTLEVAGDVRLIAVDGERSWVDGGFGELRSGSDGNLRVRPQLGNASIVWKPQFSWAVGATVVGIVHGGQRTEAGLSQARLGGDEFVVLQTLGDDRDAIDRLARDILGEMSRPTMIDGNEVIPSTSIGIAIAPQDGTDSGTLLRNADLALYRAKEAGRRTYAFFEESLNERAQQRRQLETDLRLALERGEFELLYQPLFDLEQNRICSFEALLRWRHPTRGLISPVEFVPVAEDTGLIVSIGAWVIREACSRAVDWPHHVRVAVNVSAVQFHRGALHETVLRGWPIPGSRRTGLKWRSPSRSSSKAATPRFGCCILCAPWASGLHSTTSGRAIPRSAICRASRSTSSRSTAASSRVC